MTGSKMRISLAKILQASSALAALAMLTISAEAQSLFPCGGGPNEQQVGVDMNGPVTVPLCIERPGGQYGNSAARSGPTVYIPPPGTPPPSGWKQAYGAWKDFEVEPIPGTDRYKHDFVVSLGHATPEEAMAEVRRQCEARTRYFNQSESTCSGYLIKNPYVQIIRYPDGDYFGNQAGSYYANNSTIPNPTGLVARENGKWDYCSEKVRPEGQCANIVAFLENGDIPIAPPKKPKKKKQR
ncbi:hypothetical protein K1X12_14590 [Hyphomonas sp. WL0036]|uniref:hypothetical protein n=1 Tax=Hyphomonas sediminis TaxID=2866160 RepID=UPI001C8048E5|nr:hypothetical protein [Hyphomonas sediminis]MBY9068136.1 hypothetical protein [Hyphomonas sediminis]